MVTEQQLAELGPGASRVRGVRDSGECCAGGEMLKQGISSSPRGV